MHLPSLLLFVSFLPSVVPSALPIPDVASPTVPDNSTVPPTTQAYSKADAEDADQVKQWMVDKGIQKTGYVFYSRSAGLEWAEDFVNANEGYLYYPQIFDEEFSNDFDGADPSDGGPVALACSSALAQHAEGNVRVFNNANGTVHNFGLLNPIVFFPYY